MSLFTERELAYLQADERARLARVATVGADGTPHVVPVGWRLASDDVIEIGGMQLERTKKFRDVQRHGRAAVVIDDLASVSPWRPRGIEIRGRAEAQAGSAAVIRLYPERIISWGLESEQIGERYSRRVG
jgi:pyridoxamine 5'-phosphate oxidase family protein